MADQQSVETHRGYRCHSNEDDETGRQRVKFVTDARIVVPKDDEHEHDGSQADRYGQTGTKDDPGDYSRRLHQIFAATMRRESLLGRGIMPTAPLIDTRMPNSLSQLEKIPRTPSRDTEISD